MGKSRDAIERIRDIGARNVSLDGAKLDTIGVADFVASGVLPNGAPVILKADGTVEVVSLGSPEQSRTVFSTASESVLRVCFNPNNSSQIIVAYTVDQPAGAYGDSDFFVVGGTISGHGVSFATPVNLGVTVGSSSAIVNTKFSLDFDPNTSGSFVVTGIILNYQICAVVGNITNSNLITVGSPQSWAGSNAFREQYLVFNPNVAGQFVTAYISDPYGDRHGLVILGTVSGTSITFGTPLQFHAGTGTQGETYSPRISFDPNTSGSFVVAYSDTDSNTTKASAVVGAISGTTITFGAAVDFEASLPYKDSCTPHAIEFDPNTAGSLVLSYNYLDYDTNNTPTTVESKIIAGSVSGTSITFGTPLVFTPDPDGHYSRFAFHPSTAGKFILLYTSLANPDVGKVREGTVSGNGITLTTATDILPSHNGFTNFSMATNQAGQYVAVYKDTQNSSAGTVVVGNFIGSAGLTNLTETNFLGVTAGAYTDGQLATVTLKGSVSNNQTGLVQNSDYYVQGDGTLSTSPDSPVVLVGGALSSTEILLNSVGIVPPTGTTNNGKLLTAGSTEGSASWQPAPVSLPVQTGQAGKSLTTDGTVASWEATSTGTADFVASGVLPDGAPVILKADGTVEVVSSNNLTSTNFLGTSTAAYTNSQTATIMLKGGVSTNQTALTVGSTYYVLSDGTLSTTAAAGSVTFGKALSATSVLLDDGAINGTLDFANFSVNATTGMLEIDYYGNPSNTNFSINANGELEVIV